MGVSGTCVPGGLGKAFSISGTSTMYAGGGYGNADQGVVYANGRDCNNIQLGYYGYGANGEGTTSPGPGAPGIVIVRYKTLC